MKNFICNVINQITKGLVFFIIIKGYDHIIIFPAPVFIPGQLVANECTVVLHGEIGIHVMKILGIQADTFDHAPDGEGLWKLRILDSEGEFVGHDLPAHFPIKWNWQNANDPYYLCKIIPNGMEYGYRKEMGSFFLCI